MNTAKNTVFIGLQLENCCLMGANRLLVGEIKSWMWGSLLRGGFFWVVCRSRQMFGWW